MSPTPQPSIEKGQYVAVTSEHLRRLSASEQRRLNGRTGLALSAFTPVGRNARVVSVQWLAKNSSHTVGQPESWAATTLRIVPKNELENLT